MNIIFRVDSSIQIGSGHVMRCLTLAQELRKKANVQFICRKRKGSLIKKIKSKGFAVFELDGVVARENVDEPLIVDWLGTTQGQDARDCAPILEKIKPDWLIVDHYGIDKYWQNKLKKYYKKLLVIDDLANREHNCDLLLDQNFYKDANARYKKLIFSKCKMLLGPGYALLRKEFLTTTSNLIDESLDKILVYFGGSDIKNNTLKVLQAIQSCKQANISVDVVIGPDSPYRKDILNFSSKMANVTCFDFVENIAEMMSNSDLYIGSAGTTTWERCCMGLPSIVIGIAENQIKPMEEMELAGMTFFLGSEKNVDSSDILRLLDNIVDSPSVLVEMSMKNLALVDGYGASRCASEMLINRGV